MQLKYNLNDPNSIISFAKLLIGKSVQGEFANEILSLKLTAKDKGQLGKVIEELYFKYKPNSDKSADFKTAKLELKSSGLKELSKNKGFNAKERLVLNIINYEEAIHHDFEIEFLNGKNGHLLLVFYLYEQGINILESVIKLVGDWKYPLEDIEVIRNDYEFIKNKILLGKAHELSEGDTFYLGACTKGKNANSTRTQPFNDIPAKQRAYSLKRGYLDHIIASIAGKTSVKYGKLMTSTSIAKKKTIEEIVLDKFRSLLGKTDMELVKQFDLESISSNIKDYHSRVVKAILNVPVKSNIEDYIEEFRKADIKVKTVRLKENNLPKESISFPYFQFNEIVYEDWEDSSFLTNLEQKFLFIFFQYENDKLYLRKVKFWNMPHKDVQEAKKVWAKTVEIIKNGEIVKGLKKFKSGKIIRKTNFPGVTYNSVSHVRPHGSNSKDTIALPTKDKVTNKKEYTKQCFWLNSKYVKDEIYLKD